jgi:hypothetical protein
MGFIDYIPHSSGGSGEVGPIGPKGDKGDTGEQGPKGDTGLTGAKGDTGSQGIQGIQGIQGPSGAVEYSVSLAGNSYVSTSIFSFMIEKAVTIAGVYLRVSTAPTGADLIVDVNVNGATIFSTQANRPLIAATATSGSTTTIDNPSVSAGDVISIDIDQVGSSIAGGSPLMIVIKYS